MTTEPEVKRLQRDMHLWPSSLRRYTVISQPFVQTSGTLADSIASVAYR
jgi:hypothetical protein